MSDDHTIRPYNRPLTPIERLFNRSPFSIVTMVARIRGTVTEPLLSQALAQVRLRHPNLRSRLVDDGTGTPWLTSDGAGDIPVTVVPRQSDDHWLRLVQESSCLPFDFDARPPVRFILVQSPAVSDLVILCHHTLCDGLSLAYLARDLLLHLGDPARAVDPLPDPVPMDLANAPAGLSVSPLVRLVVNRMNKKWQAARVVFDREDYYALTAAYWQRYPHHLLPVELTEAHTSALVERCRGSGVTVNSALSAAFVGAQVLVQGPRPFHSAVQVAASLRDRLPRPAGEAMGFYAGLVTARYRYDTALGFWDNARRFHRRVRPLFTDKNLLQSLLLLCYLDPSIIDAMNFKKIGALLPPGAPRRQKLAAFAARDDVVSAILKRDHMDSLARINVGTAVTNLTRLDFPRRYGALELDRLIMNPGAGFPLAAVNLVLGAVTCAGKLSLVLEFVQDNIALDTIAAVRDTAFDLLARPDPLARGAP